jgi:PKD repeat protein
MSRNVGAWLGIIWLGLAAGCGGGGGGGKTPPTADFTADKTSGSPPLTVQFTDQSAKGSDSITSWLWDFGDQTSISTAQSPSHQFSGGGPYTVSLTVTTNAGNSKKTNVGYIVVYPPPPTLTFGAR